MKLMLATLLMALCWMSFALPAHADWRWHDPVFKVHKVTYSCATLKCIRYTYLKERNRLKRRIARYNQRHLREWKYWTRLYIPYCTWYGESGTGPQFARYRYTMPNATGSGAYGKYQMMPLTYHSRAKYHDWSPVDQEIAGHKEYWAHGTSPWTNCY
jgi:hypothetical protein